MGVLEMKTRLFRLHRSRLHQNDACDDCQTIGNSVLQLFKEHILLAEQFILLALQLAPGSNIFDPSRMLALEHVR